MESRLSQRTTKEAAVDLDLKTLPYETTTYDTTQTGEVLSAVDDKKLLFKIDCRLMPILQVHSSDLSSLKMLLTPPRCITYALQSIDKTTLSYAAVFGLVSLTSVFPTQ
jgi:hypothetical protein